MNNKGFADTDVNIETPNDVMVAEKPKSSKIKSGRVDINVLKRNFRTQVKELKKNIFILTILVLHL